MMVFKNSQSFLVTFLVNLLVFWYNMPCVNRKAKVQDLRGLFKDFSSSI